MGTQLIFVVETNRTCKSDWIYIKNTIDRFYTYDRAHVRLSTVYMDGKSKYQKREKEVKSLISQYGSSTSKNKSVVIYCFDCDDYDCKPEDADFLNDVEQFCKERDYKFVWFCKDIESVYLGRAVSPNLKKKEAATFMEKKKIEKVSEDHLAEKRYRSGTSNILRILDQLPPLSRK